MAGIIIETELAAHENAGRRGVQMGSMSSGYSKRTRRAVVTPINRPRRPYDERVCRELVLRRFGLVLAVPAALTVLAAGCIADDATPIDPENPPVVADLSDVTHPLQPTDEMREAAEAQCLDDPSLTEGYVRAVDPQTETILAEITVDCAEVGG